MFPGLVAGPEDVIWDSEGNFFCSNRDGSIRKLWRNGSVSVWAHVGGHPLGIEWLREGTEMVVCEADKVTRSSLSGCTTLPWPSTPGPKTGTARFYYPHH